MYYKTDLEIPHLFPVSNVFSSYLIYSSHTSTSKVSQVYSWNESMNELMNK